VIVGVSFPVGCADRKRGLCVVDSGVVERWLRAARCSLAGLRMKRQLTRVYKLRRVM